MRISQVIVCCFGCFMGVMAIILLEINISLGCAHALPASPPYSVQRAAAALHFQGHVPHVADCWGAACTGMVASSRAMP